MTLTFDSAAATGISTSADPAIVGNEATGEHDADLSIIGSDVDPGSSFARCSDGNGTLAHLFFSDDDYELARAKAICRPCGLRVACLSEAIAREEAYGIWGGMLLLDGVPVEVKRKRGRPRKNPLPVLVVDEVPIPAHLVA